MENRENREGTQPNKRNASEGSSLLTFEALFEMSKLLSGRVKGAEKKGKTFL